MPIDTVAPGHKALNGRNNKKRNKRKEETNQQVTPPELILYFRHTHMLITAHTALTKTSNRELSATVGQTLIIHICLLM